ncbi:hypothetical protein BG005_004507 [Podila minutissima]|nr:hypothetical protein BG005_004507 [Podila minutissima]
MNYRAPYIATQRPAPLKMSDRWTQKRREIAEAAAPVAPPAEHLLPDIDLEVPDDIEPLPDDEPFVPDPTNTNHVPIGNQVPPDARCARCIPYQFASTSHNFWFCPPVKAAWDLMMLWIRTVFPTFPKAPLYNEPPDLMRDGADLSEETELADILKVALQFRAKVEHQRAVYKDKLCLENRISGRHVNRYSDDDANYQKMAEVWHHPPHITVSKEGIVLGPSLGMAPDQPEDPDQDQVQVDPDAVPDLPVPDLDATLGVADTADAAGFAVTITGIS